MVSLKSVEKQLKHIHFNMYAWGRAELRELPNILLADEKIFECVNGTYENGFALLVATNLRLLLIDKKPLQFLTVEDLRFDMINQIDYSHRLLGANINVSAGSKTLKFKSYNKERLRKLISHVQHRMAEVKTEQSSQAENQQQHLEQINQQLQTYLLAQYQQQEELRNHVEKIQADNVRSSAIPQPIKPDPQLADYLYAQNLLRQYGGQQPQSAAPIGTEPIIASNQPALPINDGFSQASVVSGLTDIDHADPRLSDLYSEGMKEIFGNRDATSNVTMPASSVRQPPNQPLATSEVVDSSTPSTSRSLEINPLRVAYAKLPMALLSRRFSRRQRPIFRAPAQPLGPQSASIQPTPNS